MATKKKMSLQEFYEDESLGSSWADDDVDLSSISVPIEKYKHSESYHDHDFNRSYRNPQYDQGPPYIIKLSNLPVTVSDDFVEDLFQSRFTTYNKLKIVVDPVSDILHTNIIKKVAFVELNTYQDLAKAVKWQDLFYKAGKRVIVEIADFNDFQYCIQFNIEHEKQIHQIEEDYFSGKLKPTHNINSYQPPGTHHAPNTHSINASPSLGDSRSLNSKPKPNPFGAAKPVDVLARQHEIEKKLSHINPTTIRTLGSIDESKSPSSAKAEIVPPPTGPNAPNPYKQNGLSLAELLSAKPDASDHERNSPKPPPIVKPIILKKKPKTERNIQDVEQETEKSNGVQVSKPVDSEPTVSSETVSIEEKSKENHDPHSSVAKTEEKPLKPFKFQSKSKPRFEKSKINSDDTITKIKSNERDPNFKNIRAESLLSSGKETDSSERPNFRKHFEELTKRNFVPKPKRAPNNFNNSEKNDRKPRNLEDRFKKLDIKPDESSVEAGEGTPEAIKERPKRTKEFKKEYKPREFKNKDAKVKIKEANDEEPKSENEPESEIKTKEFKKNPRKSKPSPRPSPRASPKPSPKPKDVKIAPEESRESKEGSPKDTPKVTPKETPQDTPKDTPNSPKETSKVDEPNGSDHTENHDETISTRGRGRGNYRGRGRGNRGRGRGGFRARGRNFNLSYVRNHEADEANTS